MTARPNVVWLTVSSPKRELLAYSLFIISTADISSRKKNRIFLMGGRKFSAKVAFRILFLVNPVMMLSTVLYSYFSRDNVLNDDSGTGICLSIQYTHVNERTNSLALSIPCGGTNSRNLYQFILFKHVDLSVFCCTVIYVFDSHLKKKKCLEEWSKLY
jgi:hypothetical protein